MKKILLILLSKLIFISLIGQKIDKVKFVDSSTLFLQLKTNANVKNWLLCDSNKTNHFLDSNILKFGIKSISQPFAFTKNSNLTRILKIKLNLTTSKCNLGSCLN